MLPSQILLNNLLYDSSQLAIPTDNVDPEQLARPSRWDAGFIRRDKDFRSSERDRYASLASPCCNSCVRRCSGWNVNWASASWSHVRAVVSCARPCRNVSAGSRPPASGRALHRFA